HKRGTSTKSHQGTKQRRNSRQHQSKYKSNTTSKITGATQSTQRKREIPKTQHHHQRHRLDDSNDRKQRKMYTKLGGENTINDEETERHQRQKMPVDEVEKRKSPGKKKWDVNEADKRKSPEKRNGALIERVSRPENKNNKYPPKTSTQVDKRKDMY
ncbi:7513_t:CDS:2, partial [Scutellospora calospora]